MATATTHDSTPQTSAQSGAGSWTFEFAALSILVALVYRIPAYVDLIGGREHLQFALFIPLGVAFLVHLRQEETGRIAPTSPIHGATFATAAILFIAALLCFDAFLNYSATSWSLSALMVSLALIHFWGGWALFGRVWSIWGFAWLMVPPPFGLDYKLINGLQFWVSGLASYVLDAMHIAHIRDGIVIRLENKDLFVAEACSGINSLFATFVVLVFSMMVLKRRWLHILLLFGLGFLAVLGVNVFRVVMLTAAHYYSPKVGAFFEEGAPHFAFGILCFGLLILLVFSFDAIICLLGAFLVDVLPARFTNWGSGERSHSRTATSPEPETARPLLERAADVRRRIRAANGPAGSGWALAVGVAFAMIAGLEYSAGAWQLAHRRPVVLDTPSEDPLAPVMGDLSKVLPSEWDGWKRVGEKTEHLNFTNAMYSTSWTYRRGSEELIVFLHRRYPDFHGMDVCYAGNGWQIKNLEGGTPDGSEGLPDTMQYISFDMDKEDEGSFVMAYVNFDYRNGRWVEIPPIYRGLSFWGRVKLALNDRRHNLQNLFSRGQQAAELAVILVQQRTTRGAESTDRTETINRLISASHLAFDPLMSNPASRAPAKAPAANASAANAPTTGP